MAWVTCSKCFTNCQIHQFDTQIAIQFENMVYVGPSLRKAEQLFVAGLSNTF